MKKFDYETIKEVGVELYYTKIKFLSLLFIQNNKAEIDAAKFLSNKENLQIFQNMVEYFAEHNLLDDFCKSNIFNILNILRYDISPKDIEIINIINSIYNKVNVQMYDYSINFYRNEYIKRYDKIDDRLDEFVYSSISNIRESMLLDPLVFSTHIFDDKNIFNNYVEYFATNKNYLNSITSILKDNPYLIVNKNFLERFKLVLIEQNKINKSIIKKIQVKCLIKDLNKMEKEI